MISSGSKVTSLDSIEAPERWSRANLIDGYWYGSWLEEELQVKLRQLALNRTEQWEKISQSPLHRQKMELQSEYERLEKEKSAIPAPQMVYAGTTKFSPQGNFKATQGKPRTIHVLNRGNVLSPGEQVHPGPVKSLGDWGLPLLERNNTMKAMLDWLWPRGLLMQIIRCFGGPWQIEFGSTTSAVVWSTAPMISVVWASCHHTLSFWTGSRVNCEIRVAV